ncbi:tigger transposable element-derived protein 4 [Danaus plexippus plexippus]|uniref:Tigger transposable element-derived protein 4 n=1 Tax=Danaus plexippus plexippus TaxID=278856 RepID=A0A212F1U2_DANPL|nr:tigger transposable element-derived protein 4 [Danaus plexippus plexippus]
MNNKRMPISSPMLQEKANVFAASFGILDFNCSTSWISRFKVRHNILAGKIIGESSTVDQNSTINWLASIKQINSESLAAPELWEDSVDIHSALLTSEEPTDENIV